jgi:uncharacterized protein YkvS
MNLLRIKNVRKIVLLGLVLFMFFSEIQAQVTLTLSKALDISETGSVITVGDGVARVYGLERAMAGEIVEFESGVVGMVLNLEESSVGVVILGDDTLIKEGHSVKRTDRIVEVPVGDAVIGRGQVGDLAQFQGADAGFDCCKHIQNSCLIWIKRELGGKRRISLPFLAVASRCTTTSVARLRRTRQRDG